MRYIIYIILIISLIQKLNAQVPGYQGKRFFVEFTGSFSAAWGEHNLSAQNYGNRSFPNYDKRGIGLTFVDRYGIGLNYVISRRTTIKLGYEYSLAGIFHNAYIKRSSPITNNETVDKREMFYQLHMNDFNLQFTCTFKKNPANLAPLGSYWQYGFRLVSAKGVLRDQKVEYGDGIFDDNFPRESILPEVNYNTHNILIGITTKYGYRAIFADRFTVDAGLDVSLFPVLLQIVTCSVFILVLDTYFFKN